MADGARVLLFDIEASNLDANFGFIFCVGYRWFGENKTHLISIRQMRGKDTTDDRKVLKEFSKIIEDADVIVSWYGSRFDVPFIQTRLLINGMAPIPDIPHIDGWKIAKYRLKFNSNRLDTVSKSIPMKGEKRNLKTSMDYWVWVKAIAGDKGSLKYIEDHCLADIQVLDDVYRAIKPFGKSLPNLSKIHDPKKEGCPSCGSSHLQKRGRALTQRAVKQKIQCQECAHWFEIPLRAA